MRSRARRLTRRAVLMLASASLLAGGATTVVSGPVSAATDTSTIPTFAPGSGRPFAETSPFNTPIGSQVRLDPNSAEIVAGMAGKGYAVAQVYADTPPVYDADASTPRYAVDCTEAWGTCDLERESVPIPAGATASPGYDANMVVVDWSTRKAYEFWQYKNDRATASWGAVCSLDGPGTGNGSTPPCRAGATGAGISRLAGIVRTYEFRQGRIDHALVGPTPNSCSSYRYPAVKSDGWSSADNCIPEGARVQLDPSVDCDALAAPAWEKMICRALQTYGWYNIDNGGRLGSPGFNIQFENPQGEADPYVGTGLTDYAAIANIPWTRLRVLEKWDSSTVPEPEPTPAPDTPEPDTQAPTPAGNVRVAGTPTTTTVPLAWDPATDDRGVTRYEVWRGDANYENWTLAGAVDGDTTSFSVGSLSPDTGYTLAVRAFDAAGNKSASSNVVAARTAGLVDTTPPTAATNLRTTSVGRTWVSLRWNASTDDVGVVKYEVWRGDKKWANWVRVATTSGQTSATVTGLSRRTTYTFAVRAFDAAGNKSASSKSIRVTTAR